MKIAPLLAAGKYSLLRLTRALRALGLVLLFAAGTAGIALAVVFPLWFFATRHTRGYTLFALLALLAALLTGGGRALLRSARQQGGFPAALRRKLVPSLVTLFITLFFICSLYMVILLFAEGRLAAAIAASGIYVLLAVMVTYFRRRNT